MLKWRILGVSGFLLLVAALALAMPGCGSGTGGSTETNPDGSIKPAPGSVDLGKEYGPGGPPKKAK